MANLAVPVMRTFTVGEYETGAYFNSNVRDAMNFVTQPPIFNAVQATVGTISSTLWTPLPLDSTIVDSYGGHSNTTNNAQYVAQVAGWCLVTAAVCWASNATGWRGIRILHNSNLAVSGSATEVSANASGVTALATPSVIVYLNVGDYVQGEGYQTSGGSLSTSVNVDANCALTVFWLHS